MSLMKCLLFTILTSLFLNRAASAEAPSKLQILARELPVTLVVDTGGAGSLLLEHSQDLTIWHPSLNVFSKLRSLRLIDRSTLGGLEFPRFYRAIGPAQSMDQIFENWGNNGFGKYTYRFQRRCFCNPGNLSGTVTVSDGKVVAVTDARGNDVPSTNLDLSQFKSIEELLAIVKEGASRADFLTVEFDPALRFPSYVDIDYYVQAADDEIRYQASDVQPIP
jgi:hypothetical protein